MAEAFWDVVVIGAGAAGLLAAAGAAERGRRTLLLEKNRKPGVKILMSGGTRCNLTHATDNRGIVEAFGPPGRFLHSALAALSVQATLDLFEAEGVATKVEETGKIFPVRVQAPWVADLRGVTLPDVAIRVVEDTHSLAARRGSLLFAHFGLSGPVVLDVSRAVSGHARPQELVLEIDLLPAVPEGAL